MDAGARRFAPLFWVQFLGAFNDQVFKNGFMALLTWRLADRLALDLDMLVLAAGALYILPFALFAPVAGQVADGVDKARMMRWVKGAEVALSRTYKVRRRQRGVRGIEEADEDPGLMLDVDAEAFIHGGTD